MSFDHLLNHRVSIFAMYYSIAYQHVVRYRESDEELRALETRGVTEDELNSVERQIETCYQRREESAVIAITFAGMALEAFFYDYAADQLGDGFVKEHLDKLDLKSKFLVYPRLLVGKAPEKSTASYQMLGKLVALRNDLVHFKSKSFPIAELNRASDFHSELNERLRHGAENAVDCVMSVIGELDRLHGGGTTFALAMLSGVQP